MKKHSLVNNTIMITTRQRLNISVENRKLLMNFTMIGTFSPLWRYSGSFKGEIPCDLLIFPMTFRTLKFNEGEKATKKLRVKFLGKHFAEG